jgi:hypothetical protein
MIEIIHAYETSEGALPADNREEVIETNEFSNNE